MWQCAKIEEKIEACVAKGKEDQDQDQGEREISSEPTGDTEEGDTKPTEPTDVMEDPDPMVAMRAKLNAQLLEKQEALLSAPR